jgi:alpha-L-arabinofuranosidase
MNLIKLCGQGFSLSKTAACLTITLVATSGFPQTNAPLPVIQIQADKVVAKIPATFYGLMTEEINYSYEGGLYGELVRNRSFKADAIPEIIKPEDYDPAKYYPVKFPTATAPKFWSAIGSAKISLDTNTVLNAALNVSLKMELAGASKDFPAGVANDGYWGIPVKPGTAYHASFFAKGKNFNGPLKVSLESADGKTIYAQSEIAGVNGNWQKYETTLTTAGDIIPSKENRLVISATKPGTFFNHHGTVWLQQVSLFPPTYKERLNGNRTDLSQLLADAQPKFLRFPGGNYVEGDYFNERFNWKQMIGPIEQRPGHRSCWGYWSTDGFGLPEFLGWCQDLGMEPVLAVFAGYTLRHDYIPAGPKLEPYVQEALEEIEYVTGDASTKWGAQRIKDGYPNPFPLHYVEIGNEDWFDKSGSYDGRFAQFYDAIKAKYPQLKIISTASVKSRVADLNDEHYYKSEEDMESQAFMYDARDRSSPTKIFVGEWATRVGSPTPNMAGALGDAAWMCCLERNADIVMMHCFAPLFVNVSDFGKGRSMQWASDLIGYDALNSYGSPSYYAQKIFSRQHGDEALATHAENLPAYSWQPSAKKKNGSEQPRPAPREVKSLFYSATRDSANGKITVKIVNRADAAQSVKIDIAGANAIAGEGTATVLKAANRDETNSLSDPQHLVPVTEKISGLGASFTRTFPPCSITVLELEAK